MKNTSMALLLEYYEKRNEKAKQNLTKQQEILARTGKDLDKGKAEESDEDRDKYFQSKAPQQQQQQKKPVEMVSNIPTEEKKESEREEMKQYDPKITNKLSETELEWFFKIMQTLEQVPKENKGLANFANGIKMGVSAEIGQRPKEESKSSNQPEESKSRNQPELKENKSHKRSYSCL